MMSMYMVNNQKDWDECLPYIIFAYNTSIQNSTLFSPFYIVHGREPRLPSDIILNINTQGIENIKPFVVDITHNLQKVKELVEIKIEKSQIKNKNIIYTNRRSVSYNIDDLVLVYSPKKVVGFLQAEKLMHNYYVRSK